MLKVWNVNWIEASHRVLQTRPEEPASTSFIPPCAGRVKGRHHEHHPMSDRLFSRKGKTGAKVLIMGSSGEASNGTNFTANDLSGSDWKIAAVGREMCLHQTIQAPPARTAASMTPLTSQTKKNGCSRSRQSRSYRMFPHQCQNNHRERQPDIQPYQ